MNGPTDVRSGLPPRGGSALRVLVLGSFPGERSLAQHQYYAHPRNAFWPILGELLGFDPRASYAERLARLEQSGIGLWDVVDRCIRPGSLDSALRAVQPNDVASLVRAAPLLQGILLNGAAAHALFLRHVAATLDPHLALRPMPSTSPANAALSYAAKRDRWCAALREFGAA
jgi:double-stranded uracil-DNA glycosylase